jgi:DNA-binding MltR family transcriptional regulator
VSDFVETLKNESDRACAILGAAMLDHALGELVRSAMTVEAPARLFEGYGPIASFSARIDISLGLGIVSRDEHHDLQLIRKVRNAFAHDANHELSFVSELIAQRIGLLKVAAAIFANPIFTPGLDTPRNRFQIEMGCLRYSIQDVRGFAVERPDVPPDYVGWLQRVKRFDV